MKLLAVVAITLAVAFASKHPRYDYEWLDEKRPEYGIEHNQFESGKEYQYIYNGQLMTGIPQSSEQHSATRIQAVVSIVFDGEKDMRMQMRHVRFASLNERVAEPRSMQPFDLFEPIDIVDKHLETLRLPVKCEYKHGLVKDMTFDGEEQPWSANIKRAVLNMLQVNLHKKNEQRVGQTEMFEADKTDDQKLIRDGDFFVSREDSMEGNCETAYTVLSLPLEAEREYTQSKYDVLNVTKSINFERCDRRPTVRYNFRVAEICPTCEERYTSEDKMLRSSTVIRQSLLVTKQRENVLVERVVAESQYTYVPYTEEGTVIQTYVNMTLELVKSSNKVHTIPQLSSPIKSDSNLIATMDWDIEKEEHFMAGEGKFAKNTPFSEINDKVAFIKNLLEKTVHYMRESVQEEAPRQFARLVKVMRLLKRSEIEKVFADFVKQSPFTKEESTKVKSLVIDALALAGTKDTVYFLVDKIERKQISTLRAALVLRKFTQIRTVSEHMIEKVWQLTKTERCEENKIVCQGAMLTVGSMLNAICKPSEDRLAVDFARNHKLAHSRQCNNEIKNKWAERMIERLERSEETVSRIVVLKMIGNAALVNTVEKLTDIAVNVEQKYTPLERLEAIMSLRQSVHFDNVKLQLQKVLVPLYLDITTPQQVRIAALHIILATQPKKSIIDQLTQSLMSEENKQVAAFAFTSMHSLANSTIPCEKRFAKDLTLSLRNAPFLPVSQWISFSKLIRTQYHSEKYNQGFAVEYTTLMSNSSRLPQHMGINLDMNVHNLWAKNVFSAGFVQQNVERYMRDIVRKMSHDLMTPTEDIFDSEETTEESKEDRKQRRVSPKFASSLEKIFKDLSIEERREESEEVSILAFYLRQANQDQAFIPITKEILSEEWLNVLTSSSEEMTLEKMVKRARKLLTDVTLPFDIHHATFVNEMSRKITTVLGLPLQLTIKTPVVMQARGQIKIDFDAKNPMRKFAVHLKEIKPSMTVSYVQKVESWSPIVNSALRVVSSVHINTPFSGKLSVNVIKSQPEIKITYQPINKAVDVLRVTSRPVTSVLVWPKSLKQWKEADQKTILGSEWTHATIMDKKLGKNALGLELSAYGRWHSTPSSKVSTTPYSLFAGANKFVVNIKPGFEMPKEYEMTVSGKLFERLVKGKMGQKMNNFYTESDENLASSSEEESSQEYARKYEGVNPTRHQLKFVFDTRGSPVKREAVIETELQCGENKKACTYKLNVRRTAIPRSEENKEWKLNAEMSTLYPETPKNVNELKDRKYMSRFAAKWGNDKFLDIKLVGEQSEIMEKLVEQSLFLRSMNNKEETRKSIFSPISQREHTLKYGLLDQYKMDADYSVSPSFRNMTEKVLSFVKYMYYYETNVDYRLPVEIKGRQQIRARLTIDPINRRYVNLTIETPAERVTVKDIMLPMPVNGVNIRRQSLDIISPLFTSERNLAVCQLRSDRVNTFDGVKYTTPIPECFTLLTKDCHAKRQSKFAVFVKEEEDEQKTLKIMTEHIKLIVKQVSETEFECELNGEKSECSSIEDIYVHGRHLALRITQEEYLKIELPEAGIRVYFDGLSVNVKTSTHFRGQLCGLCGQWDKEERCDLINNKRQCRSANIPSQVRDFVKSYIVDESCEMPEEEQRYTYEPLSWEENETNEELYKETRHTKYEREIKPRHITRVIEQRDQLCFSKQPVYRCPTNTRPVEHQMTMTKVTYACIDRMEELAERLERIANERRVVDEVSELTASFTHELYQPLRCIRL